MAVAVDSQATVASSELERNIVRNCTSFDPYSPVTLHGGAAYNDQMTALDVHKEEDSEQKSESTGSG
jgi:hypothetical protein